MGTLQQIYVDLRTMRTELIATYRTKELIALVKKYEETTNSKFINARPTECIKVAQILRKKVKWYKVCKVNLDIIKILWRIYHEEKKNPEQKNNKGVKESTGSKIR